MNKRRISGGKVWLNLSSGFFIFAPMKRTTSLPLALVGLMFCVTACDIDENRDVGQLFVSALDAANPTGGYLSGQILLDGYVAATGTGTGWDLVDGLNLDQTYQVSFQAPYFDLSTQSFSFHGAERDSIRFLLNRSDDGFSAISVRSIANTELDGLPIQLDGVTLDETTPATIYVTRDTEHTLAIASESCTFADSTFVAEEATYEMDFFGADVSLEFLPTFEDAELIYRGRATGLTGTHTISSIGGGLVSAFLPGFVATPAGYHFDSACDQSFSFAWIEVEEGFSVDELFPDFELAEVGSGDLVSLRQHRGQVVLLSFWFINCPACNEEMPMFQDMLEEYGDQGFQVLALNPYTTDFANLPAWVEDHPEYQFRFLLDAGNTPLAQRIGISSFPTNFLLGPDGLVALRAGQLSQDVLESALQEMLGLNP